MDVLAAFPLPLHEVPATGLPFEMAATSTSASVLADVHYRQRFVLVVTTLLLVLSTATVILRLWARGIIHQRLRSDDFWMLLALPFSYIDGICQYLGKATNLALKTVKY